MMSGRRSLSRRAMLRGAGGVAAGLPLLEAMGQRAYAAPPLRLIVYVHHQGTDLGQWKPTGVGTGMQLSPLLMPLAPFRDRVVVVSGASNLAYDTINPNGDAHTPAYVSLLTAQSTVNPEDFRTGAAGPSLDQVAGARLKGTARFSTINLAMGIPGKPLFWSGKGQVVAQEHDPRRAWTKLFSTLPTSMPTPPSARQRLLAKRTVVADAVLESYRRTAQPLGASDRALLERHMELLAESEKSQVVTPGVPAGAACGKPTQTIAADADILHADREPDVVRAQIRNAVMALACDQTRVVTLVHTHEDRQNFAWLSPDLPGPYANWHTVIHQQGGTVRPQMLRAMTWYTEQFAQLLTELAAVKEGEGTLLDRTLVLWISEFGDGSRHITKQLPVVLAGGGLVGGRHIDAAGRSTNDLFAGVLQRLGQTDAAFGLPDPAMNRGAIAL